MEAVGHNIPNIDGVDSIIRREPPSPVSEWVLCGTRTSRLILNLRGAPAQQSAIIRRGGMHRSRRTAPEAVNKVFDALVEIVECV